MMITFFDYDGEWLIAPLIARENGEANPILVCSSDEEYEDYFVYPDKYESTDFPWYQIYTDRLKLIKKFGRYCIYEVTDLDAFHAIWMRLSKNYSIAEYVFAADCDLDQLETLLSKKSFLDSQDLKSLASWSYWQQFGGGADEHFAYYFSQDPALMTRFKFYLTQEQYKARYQNISQVDLDKDGITGFMKRLPDERHLFCLYKKALNSVLNIETKEAHRTWWANYNEVNESEYDDEDYQIFLAYKKEVNELLQEINTIKPYDEFVSGNYCYKIIAFDDWEYLKELWDQYDAADYIEGIFSADTDIELLKQKILQQDRYTQPESLIKLGSWSITRIRDSSFYGYTAMLYVGKRGDLDGYLDEQSHIYKCHPVNNAARQYR